MRAEWLGPVLVGDVAADKKSWLFVYVVTPVWPADRDGRCACTDARGWTGAVAEARSRV